MHTKTNTVKIQLQQKLVGGKQQQNWVAVRF